MLGMRRWRELVTEKNGRILFDRPKPTVGCSANGRRRLTEELVQRQQTLGCTGKNLPYLGREILRLNYIEITNMPIPDVELLQR